MSKLSLQLINTASILIIFVINLSAQMPTRPTETDDGGGAVEGDSTLYYVVLLGLIIGLVGAVGWWWNSKKAAKSVKDDIKSKKDSWETESVDANKEMEWLRKHSKTIGRKEPSEKTYPKGLPKTSNVLNKVGGLNTNDADFTEFGGKLT